MPDVDSQLLALQKDYLTELPEQLDEIESLILKLEKNEEIVASFNELIRMVHTVKGGVGSFGIEFASIIFHNFEDNLEAISLSKAVTEKQIQTFLSFNDLFREYVKEYSESSNMGGGHFKDRLQEIIPHYQGSNKKVLIVENSKLIQNWLHDFLSEKHNCMVAFAKSGIMAFERLVLEDFDYLITSEVVGSLSGSKLIKSIKAIKGDDLDAILLTSNPDDFKSLNEASAIVEKNPKSESVLSELIGRPESSNTTSSSIVGKYPNRILFIDDDPFIHNLVKISLERVKEIEAIEYCHSGAVAIEKLKDFNPDLIICDYIMPEMDGPSTLKKIRALTDNKTPFFFLTGKSDNPDDLISLGAQGVLKKPFNPIELHSLISELWLKL